MRSPLGNAWYAIRIVLSAAPEPPLAAPSPQAAVASSRAAARTGRSFFTTGSLTTAAPRDQPVLGCPQQGVDEQAGEADGEQAEHDHVRLGVALGVADQTADPRHAVDG